MKNKCIGLMIFLVTISSAHAGFQDNDNNRKIEACRAKLQVFLSDSPFENGMLNGVSAGTPCYLRYFNVTEYDHGNPVYNGFVLTTYIKGNPYFSSMEVGMDRDVNVTGIHTIMHGCSVSSRSVVIDTEYIDPYAPTRQEHAALKKDSHGRLVSAQVRTNLADQTCNFK